MSIDFSNASVVVNGKVSDESVILQENDVCVVSCFPAGRSQESQWNVLDSILSFVTLGIYGVASVITAACTGKTIGQHIIGSVTESASSSSSEQSSITSIPQIKGSKNSSIAERVYPLVLGTHLVTPQFIGNPYTSIDPENDTYGEKQYFTALYLLGYSELKVTDIRIGETLIAKNTEDTRYGSISVYEQSLYKEYVKAIEIQQENKEVSLYPQKVVQTERGVELLHPEDADALIVPCFSAQNPQKVQIEILFDGLIAYDDSGKKIDATVDIKTEWSSDDGVTWLPFAQFKNCTEYDENTGISTFTLQKATQMRFIAERTFTYDEIINVNGRVVEIRVSRVTERQADATNLYDTVSVTSIRTWCFDYAASKAAGYLVPQVPIIAKDRDKTCRLAIKIEASDSISGSLDDINMICQSCARVWNANTETWSAASYPTNNPAALALLTMQSPMLGKRMYKDTQIDLVAHGELYEYCENRNFECCGVVTAQKKLCDLLDAIYGTSRAYRTLNGKKRSVFIDKPRDSAVLILSNQNVISASNSKEFPEEIDGLKVKFINRKNGYQIDYMYVMYDGKSYTDPECIFEDVEYQFITNPDHVWTLGRSNLAMKKLRPESWQRKISVDGNLLYIGALIECQDDTLVVGIGDGAEVTGLIIEDGYLKGIVTDGLFNISDLSQEYGLKILQSNGTDDVCIRTYPVSIIAEDIYTEFTLKNPIPVDSGFLPTIGDLVSFGILDKITTKALITSLSRNEDGTFDVELVPYDEGVYTADSEAIPEFDSKVTIPQKLTSLEKYDSAAKNGLSGKSAYKIDIVSSNGLIFRQESRDTVLKARVWLGDVEVTESLLTSQFRWIRTSNDTAADAVWNQNHYVGYKEVTITPADFFARADFKCEIVEA